MQKEGEHVVATTRFLRHQVESCLEPELRKHGFTVSWPHWPRGIEYFQPYPWADEHGTPGNIVSVVTELLIPDFFHVIVDCPIANRKAGAVSRVTVWNMSAETPLNGIRTLIGLSEEAFSRFQEDRKEATVKPAETFVFDPVAALRAIASQPTTFSARSPEEAERSMDAILHWFDKLGWEWLDHMLDFAKSFPTDPFGQ